MTMTLLLLEKIFCPRYIYLARTNNYSRYIPYNDEDITRIFSKDFLIYSEDKCPHHIYQFL